MAMPPWLARIWDRVRPTLTLGSLPLWLSVFLIIFKTVPEWSEKLNWWVDAAKKSMPVMGVIASVIESPLFAITLLVVAFVYLFTAGRPSVVATPSRTILIVLGRLVFAVYLLAVLITAGYGFIEIKIQEAATQRQQPFIAWALRDDQRLRLGKMLDQRTERFPIRINSLMGSSQSQIFGFALYKVFLDHHWPAVWLIDPGLRPDIVGVEFSFPKDIAPGVGRMSPHAAAVEGMFNEIGIEVSQYRTNNRLSKQVENGAFWIIIGNQP